MHSFQIFVYSFICYYYQGETCFLVQEVSISKLKHDLWNKHGIVQDIKMVT